MSRPSASALLRSGELEFEFFRASGPGGQNVNKVSTAVRLRFDIPRSSFLPAEVKARLLHLAGRRGTGEGVLVIEAQRFRTQDRNREDALERLMRLINRAWEPPRARRSTRPTAASRRRRLEGKRRRGQVKEGRSRGDDLGE
jgi:ribosome-associated protein